MANPYQSLFKPAKPILYVLSRADSGESSLQQIPHLWDVAGLAGRSAVDCSVGQPGVHPSSIAPKSKLSALNRANRGL
jgi:hypothetical protein